MDVLSSHPDVETGLLVDHAGRLEQIIHAASALLAARQNPAEAGSTETVEHSLRALVARALLVDEWGASVDARLTEACTVLDLPASHEEALKEADIGSWFANAWGVWSADSLAALVPQLLDARIPAKDAPKTSPAIPSDVVEATTEWLAGMVGEAPPRILGAPAGSGALVTSLVRKVLATGRFPADEITAGLRLVDPDRERLDLGCVILARALERGSKTPPKEVLQRVRATARVHDVVEWAGSTDERFNLVLGAVPLGLSNDERPGSPDNDLSAEYLQILTDVVAEDGAATIIAAATAVTAPTGLIAEARDRLLARFKTAEFLTYDRAPVPLLGSADGASRVIARVTSTGDGEVTTTPLMRCSPAGRLSALTDPPRTVLHQTPPMGSHSFIPRIGSDLERRLVDAVIVTRTQRWKRFDVELNHGDFRGGDDVFSVGTTARDRFSIVLKAPKVWFGEKPTANARFGVRPLDPELADPALAVLLTRTAFWWWMVTGDGLHVRRGHITEPLSWIRFLSPEELELAASVAAAWRTAAQAAAGGDAQAGSRTASERSSLTLALDEVLLSHMGTVESSAVEFLSRTSFADV